jgi:hypothetical protein
MSIKYDEQELRKLFKQITAPFELKKDYRPYLIKKIKERRKQLGYLQEEEDHVRKQMLQLTQICRSLVWVPI